MLNHVFITFNQTKPNAPALTSKNTFNPQPEMAFNLCLLPFSPSRHKHLQMAHLQSYPRPRLSSHARSRSLNLSRQQNGNDSLLPRVFSTRSEIGGSGMRRNRSGSIDGEWMGGIGKKKNSGLRRFLLMLVSGHWTEKSSLVFPLLIIYLFIRCGLRPCKSCP